MEQQLINLIREIGVNEAIRLIWALVILIVGVCGYIALRILWIVAQRGNPAQDALIRAYERQEDEITETNGARWRLIARIEALENELRYYKQLVQHDGLTKLQPDEIARNAQERTRLQRQINDLNVQLEYYRKTGE